MGLSTESSKCRIFIATDGLDVTSTVNRVRKMCVLSSAEECFGFRASLVGGMVMSLAVAARGIDAFLTS